MQTDVETYLPPFARARCPLVYGPKDGSMCCEDGWALFPCRGQVAPQCALLQTIVNQREGVKTRSKVAPDEAQATGDSH